MAGSFDLKPGTEDAPKIKVSFEDIRQGRAYLRIPFVGKLLLAHWSGAPWADRKPDAFLHALQVEVLAHREREQIVHGASRLGKSVLGGCRGLEAALLPGAKLAIVAARYDHVNHEFQYVAKGLKRLFGNRRQAFIDFKYRHSPAYHAYQIHSTWGAEVGGYSTDADEGAALLGQEFTHMVLGEGSHISKHILETKAMRALDGAMMNQTGPREIGSLYIFTTPKQYEGCSAAEWERVMKATNREPEKVGFGRVPWPQTVWLREANILENPAYDRSVYDARKATLTKAAFDEQYRGRMTFATGRIYEEFIETVHERPRPGAAAIRDMRLGVGIDTGAYFAAVLFGIDKAGIIWQLGEVYTQKVSIFDSTDEVREMVTEVLGPVYETEEWALLADRVELWVVDPASQHKIELNDLLDPVSISTPTRGQGAFDLLPTIDQCRALFRANRLFLLDDATWTLDQIKKYVWKQTKTVGSKVPVIREPRKDYDHVMDAMRFIVVPLMEMGPLEEAPPPVTVEEAWRNAQRDMVHGPLRAQLQRAEEFNPLAPVQPVPTERRGPFQKGRLPA